MEYVGNDIDEEVSGRAAEGDLEVRERSGSGVAAKWLESPEY